MDLMDQPNLVALFDLPPGDGRPYLYDDGEGRMLCIARARTREPVLDVWREKEPHVFSERLARLRLVGRAWYEADVAGSTLRWCRWAYGARRKPRLLLPPMADTLLALANPGFFLDKPRGATRAQWCAEALRQYVFSDRNWWWRCDTCDSDSVPGGKCGGQPWGPAHRATVGWATVLLLSPPDWNWEPWPWPGLELVSCKDNRAWMGGALLPELAWRRGAEATLGDLPPANEWHAVPAAVLVEDERGLRMLRKMADALALPGSLFDPVRRKDDARVARAIDALPRSYVARGLRSLECLSARAKGGA